MLSPNTILQNRYQIIRQLAQGGMGTVYEALDERLDATVALKESHFTDDKLRKQFEREARLLARLRHPAMTRVIDHFKEGDGQFLVMDFIAGDDLCEMLQKHGGAFPYDRVLEWADQLLDALNYLHRQEPPIIHRDLKPQNLKLSNSGQVILLDFGLAKEFVGQVSRVPTPSSIFGYTPNYAPLEQIQGTGTDPRSDLYSLAATLYHLMTGIVPPDVLSRLTATIDGQPDPLRSAHEINQNIAVGVADVLHRTLAIARNQRPDDATDMRRLLRDAAPSLTVNNVSETDEESLPPTIISLPPTRHPLAQELTPSPTIEGTPPSLPLEPAPTVASPTVRAPASPTNEYVLTKPTKTSPPLGRSVKKFNSLPYGVAVVLGIVVIVTIVVYKYGAVPLGNTNKVKIGVFMSLTGYTANFGISSTNGIKMATDEINKAGGINGKQVELDVQDDGSDSSQAAAIVTRFVTQDRVNAILGEVASSRSIAAAPIAQNAKIPMLTPSSTNPEVTKKGDYIFRSCFIDPVQGAAIAQFAAKTLGKKRAAIMVDRKNDYSTGLEKVINVAFTRMGGEMVVTQSYLEGDQDFNAQINSIKGANPDVIFVPGYYGDVALFAKQARDKGVTVPLVGGDGWDARQLYEIGGKALNGSYFTNHYSPYDSDPHVQKFVNDYKTRYGSIPDALAATAYDGARILFDAIKRANSLDGKAIRDALAATKDFPGLTGKFSFNENRDAVKPIIMIEIKDGGIYAVRERVKVEGTL